MVSHPSWVCGLKHNSLSKLYNRLDVTPFVGVWIETGRSGGTEGMLSVTPFVGVWIETDESPIAHRPKLRHTLRGCVD